MMFGAEEPSSDEKRKLFKIMHVLAPGSNDQVPFKYRNQTELRAETEDKTNSIEKSSQFLLGLKLLLPEKQENCIAQIPVFEVLL